MNLVAFGRAVTNVLQNLRATESEFDSWYEPQVAQMEEDPLLGFFYKLRSEILKKGVTGTSVKGRIDHFDFPKDLERFGPRPPGAQASFTGDARGGTGWEIQELDGSTEKYYVQLLSDIGSFEVYFRDAPDSHLGDKLKTKGIEVLCTKYYEYLRSLLDGVHQRFGGN